MMNRRQLLGMTPGLAMLARLPQIRAATYDLIIKGGRVIDPSVGLDGIRDVGIAGGRIAAVEASIIGDATETADTLYPYEPCVIDGNLVSGRTWHENTPLLVEFLRLLKANA